MATLKYCFIIFLSARLGVPVLCNFAKGENVCSGENSVLMVDICYVMIKNLTLSNHAKDSCNSTGGQLWTTSDLPHVFELIKNNIHFTGSYWVDNANYADITIDRRTLGSASLPTVRLGHYGIDQGLKMTINYYTSSFYSFEPQFSFICKYDFALKLKPTSGNLNHKAWGHDSEEKIPLFALIIMIILGVLLIFFAVGFFVILAIICKRMRKNDQYKALYLAATSPENQDRYDAPNSNANRTLVYDVPLKDKYTKERETLLEGETKEKDQHSIFHSIRNAAQAVVTRKNRHHDSKSKDSQEMQEMRIYDHKKTSKNDGNTKSEKQDVLSVELPRNATLNELKFIEKGKVGKVASMFEPSKSEGTDDNIAKKNEQSKPVPKPKPRDLQQRESKLDFNDSIVDKTKTVLPKSTSKSSMDKDVERKENTEGKTGKKKDVKKETDRTNSVNGKDVKKGSILDKVKESSSKEKDKSDEKGKEKDNKKVNKKGNTIDVEKRKEEERLKQIEMDKEIERQRDIAKKAHETSHEYMYVEDVEKKIEQIEEDFYEPVLAYENEESC